MASRILGMGDVLSLVEEARRNVDLDEAEKLAKKVKSGKGFDLDDFKSQMLQMKKMGGLSALMDKLPAQLAQLAQGANVDEKVDQPHHRHHQLHDAGRARQAGADQGLAQAPHRGRVPAYRCRKSTAC